MFLRNCSNIRHEIHMTKVKTVFIAFNWYKYIGEDFFTTLVLYIKNVQKYVNWFGAVHVEGCFIH